MAQRDEVTFKRVRKILNYDPRTGIFKWKEINSPRVKVGDVAGCPGTKNSYLQTRIDNKLYYNHRLAWLYVYGYFPENQIDHINRDFSDNRIKNLREVSQSCNIRNTGNPKDNTSGVKGVWYRKDTNKWTAEIKAHGRKVCLGCYRKFHNAVFARLAGEQCLGWHKCDNRTPAKKYVDSILRVG